MDSSYSPQGPTHWPHNPPAIDFSYEPQEPTYEPRGPYGPHKEAGTANRDEIVSPATGSTGSISYSMGYGDESDGTFVDQLLYGSIMEPPQTPAPVYSSIPGKTLSSIILNFRFQAQNFKTLDYVYLLLP